jgi:hypothetical protein
MNTMSATLLTLDEWERLLGGQVVPSGQVPALGTIMDVLELAEAAKKGRRSLDERAFRTAWKQLREAGGALRDGRLFLACLDQDCLAESLFEERQGPSAINLWAAVMGTATTPAHSVRRLILRPSDTKWWGDDAYEEMEERMGGGTAA